MPLPAAVLPVLAFARSWWKAALGALLAAPLFFLLGQCDGKKIERQDWEAKVARDKAAQAGRERAADANLERQRTRDDAAARQRREEIDHATQGIPDQAPSDRQRARACLELRRQAAAEGRPQRAC